MVKRDETGVYQGLACDTCGTMAPPPAEIIAGHGLIRLGWHLVRLVDSNRLYRRVIDVIRDSLCFGGRNCGARIPICTSGGGDRLAATLTRR